MTLAIDGGDPVWSAPFPNINDATGRILGQEEIDAVTRVVTSGTLWRVTGREASRLEDEFASYLGVDHAVASSSGTAALHLAVAAVDPEPGDEVIVPPLTDFGTAIGVLACNAIPVFADVHPETGCLTPETVAARITERTRAVIVVHLFGAWADVEGIKRVCAPRGITVIEDCAQAYGTTSADGSRLAGAAGDIGCFSLQQSKHITAGDGGLSVTSDSSLAERMRLYADKGWPRKGGLRTHLFFGMNYRMTELVAAVARVQLRRLPAVLDARRRYASQLTINLDAIPGWKTVPLASIPQHAFWLYPIILDPDMAGYDNHTLAAALNAEGIPATGGYLDRVLYLTPALQEKRTYGRSGFPLQGGESYLPTTYSAGDCPIAEDLVSRRLVVLPCNEKSTVRESGAVGEAAHKVHLGLAGKVAARGR